MRPRQWRRSAHIVVVGHQDVREDVDGQCGDDRDAPKSIAALVDLRVTWPQRQAQNPYTTGALTTSIAPSPGMTVHGRVIPQG